MRYLILLTAISFCLFACTSTTEDNNNESRHSQNIEVVQNYIKAVEAMDHEAMSVYLDDNYIGRGPSHSDSINKAQAVENWRSHTENLYERIHYNRSRLAGVNIPDGPAKGDWVANWAELSIVYKDSKDSVTIWANTNYQVENGKIVKSLTFYNEADALRQLGYEIVPPEESK